MKIEFMKNVYGIDIIRDINFDQKCNLLYASNGTMKSSFAKGIHKIINGELPEELIYDLDPKYSIDIFGNKHTEKMLQKQDNVICFTSNFLKEKIWNIDNIPVLLVNEELGLNLRNVEKEQKDNCKELMKFFKKLLNTNKDETVFQIFEKVYKKRIETVNDLIKFFKSKKLDNIFPNKEKTTVFLKLILNDNVNNLIKNSNSLKEYIDFISKQKQTKFVDKKFTIFELEEISNNFKKNSMHFFDKGNYIVLVSNEKKEVKVESIDDLEEIIKEESHIIYDSSEAKLKLEILKKSFENNINTKKIIKSFENINQKWVIELLQDEDFQKNYFDSILFENEDFIFDYVNKNYKYSKQIELIEKEANNKYDESKWNLILNEFKTRFQLPFEVEIENKVNSILKNEIPTIIFKYKNKQETKEIKKNNLETIQFLSSGEIKALFFLSLLYKVNVFLESNKKLPILLILDDIVESFDYQNKYAILNYLYEFIFDTTTYGKNNKLILLSHNFDFIRTCQYHFGKNTKTILFLKNNNILEYKDFFESPYDSIQDQKDNAMSVFREWREQVNRMQNFADIKDFYSLIALIPVIRNVNILLNTNSHISCLNDVMHVRKIEKNKNSYDIKWNDLQKEFDFFKIKTIQILNKNYDFVLNTITKACEQINLDIEKHNIEKNIYEILKYKIILAYGIRIILETKMLNILDQNNIKINWNKIITTQVLHTKLRNLDSTKPGVYKENLRKTVVKALAIVNEVVHINSFMYEPLIDIDLLNLNSLYKEINNL